MRMRAAVLVLALLYLLAGVQGGDRLPVGCEHAQDILNTMDHPISATGTDRKVGPWWDLDPGLVCRNCEEEDIATPIFVINCKYYGNDKGEWMCKANDKDSEFGKLYWGGLQLRCLVCDDDPTKIFSGTCSVQYDLYKNATDQKHRSLRKATEAEFRPYEYVNPRKEAKEKEKEAPSWLETTPYLALAALGVPVIYFWTRKTKSRADPPQKEVTNNKSAAEKNRKIKRKEQ